MRGRVVIPMCRLSKKDFTKAFVSGNSPDLAKCRPTIPGSIAAGSEEIG
jgi:hypothetical protein